MSVARLPPWAEQTQILWAAVSCRDPGPVHVRVSGEGQDAASALDGEGTEAGLSGSAEAQGWGEGPRPGLVLPEKGRLP